MHARDDKKSDAIRFGDGFMSCLGTCAGWAWHWEDCSRSIPRKIFSHKPRTTQFAQKDAEGGKTGVLACHGRRDGCLPPIGKQPDRQGEFSIPIPLPLPLPRHNSQPATATTRPVCRTPATSHRVPARSRCRKHRDHSTRYRERNRVERLFNQLNNSAARRPATTHCKKPSAPRPISAPLSSSRRIREHGPVLHAATNFAQNAPSTPSTHGRTWRAVCRRRPGIVRAASSATRSFSSGSSEQVE